MLCALPLVGFDTSKKELAHALFTAVFMEKQKALDKIKSLVERFEEQKEFYKKTDYNETQTRRDFIDPFFKALGWDVDNENGYAESYREVIHEDRVKVGNATKAPDYSFRLVGGKRLFFLEAKKPSVAIKDDIQPAYQVRRYGWSAKMPISVITDFEEFAIYDCTNKPKPTDKASNGRIKYLTYDNYLNEFDFLWDTFAKERVLKGSFDKYISNDKNKKGTTTVDNEFLQSLDKWRVELAVNIAQRNKTLSEDALNFIVQHTIDRIIFLRIAEDRSAEPYENLKTAVKSGDFYQNLLQLFHFADQKYNSGLFDFEKDTISTKISIDNKVVKSIISELYYPVCPYEFSVLSVEILGSAYEQFLGKQITLSKSGRATIEEKPEVRKAGGVYYTPQYIVDYIVKNTVGKQVANKTPKEVSKLKIVDPACGSGSFLIGTYQFLLDWHKDYYNQNRASTTLSPRGNREDVLTPTGELTTAEKKRILLNNIYGVDLDSNAVEVTKLSLLLKCMEGETKETIEAQTKLFHERILPTLDNNIKSGNSLIDLDYYDNELDFGEERKVKPFSWQKAFPEVFKQGGFDCVVGNPPYVVQKQDSIYNSYYKWNTDLYLMFFEKVLDKELLRKDGLLGFITPRFFLVNKSCKDIRKYFLSDVELLELTETSPFEGVNTECVIALIKNSKPKNLEINIKTDLNGNIENSNLISKKYSLNNEHHEIQTHLTKDDINVLSTIETNTVSLKQISTSKRGMEIGKNDFISQGFKTLIGSDTNKYKIQFANKYVDIQNPQYLRLKSFFDNENLILLRRVSSVLLATMNEDNYAFNKNLYGIKIINEKFSPLYILALLNSNLLNFYYQKKFSMKKIDLFPEIQSYLFNSLPIKSLPIEQQTDIIKLVNQLLQLNTELQTETLPNRIEQIKQRIEYAEDKINELVYQIYELTEEEIRLIEK